MSVRTVLQWFVATSLVPLLLSCGTTRHAPPGPSGAAELSRYLLVIQKSPEGHISHTWKPLGDVEGPRYLLGANSGRLDGPVARVSLNRDCEAERDECEEMCRSSLKGRNWSHASAGSKSAICREKCRPAYLDCCRVKESSGAGTLRVSFPAVDDAVDWLKRNRREVLVGTVVVIVGVAFVVVVAGSGGAALILAPAVLLASSSAPPAHATTPVSP